MAKNLAFKPVMWFMHVALICAVITSSVAAEESTLKTASSSRQSKTFSYQPFGGKLGNKNLPLIQVKINNTLLATFLLDTGFNESLLTDEIVDKLRLKSYPVALHGSVYKFEGKSVNAVTLDSIDVGGFNFAKGMFLVFKKNRIALAGQHIDGIIGINVLRYFAYLFDFRQCKITMFAPARLTTSDNGSPPKYVSEGLTPDEVKVLGFSDAKSAKIINSEEDGRKYVHVQCSNSGKSGSEDLLLDTGATTTIISPALANQLGLKPTSENVESSGFPGIEYISTAPMEQFQIGGLALRDLPIDYSSQRAYDSNLPSALGMNVLSRFLVLMDFPSGKLYLQPYPSAVPAITIGPPPAPATPPATATPPAK